ncbi:MAG: V-type ATP synthase subunit E [Candidatus Eisenbacteria bacterium]|nr:V-type ATP synthase subunit E [Candidatus Eisenbacteria bacterium]
MAVDDILKRIKADAEEVARKIVAEGQVAADALATEANARAGVQKKEQRARAEQRAQEDRNRITTLARLAARRELLEEKQGLIDRVFDEAGSRIAAMEQGEYRRFIAGLLKSTVESGDEEVLIGEGEGRLDQAFLDSMSKELGKGGGLKLASERRPIAAGFVLRSGRVETNCALATILRDAREQLETEVAAILFGSSEE